MDREYFDEDYCDDEECYDEEFYDLGEEITLNKGDYIDTTYGKQWVTGFSGNSIWTSPYEEDIETGRGRGVRESSVNAIQKQGLGMWYNVKWDREFGGFTVIEG